MLKNLYNISNSLLFNSQAALNVHGQNVANASTPGYHRRTVNQVERASVSQGNLFLGTGAEIQRLQRHFNRFIAEGQYDKGGETAMWQAQYGNLSAMDKLFSNSDSKGLTKGLTEFWKQWQALSENPEQAAARTALLGKAKTLAGMLRSRLSDMQSQLSMIEKSVAQETAKANDLMRQIAEVNRRIVTDGNPEALRDTRDQLVSKLSGIVGIRTNVDGEGRVNVMLKSGQPLVEGDKVYSLRYEGPKVVDGRLDASTYTDAVHFKGSSNRELTLECTTQGNTDGSTPAAKFRVSLDGGKTWLTNADGSTKEFTADGPSRKIRINGVDIWFGKKNDPTTAATTQLGKGDRFLIKPKSNVYWYKNSSTAEDVTPQEGNDRALSGGSLAGLLRARDNGISSYAKKLNAFTKSLIWEVNRAHSQGAGLKHMTNVLGSYKAEQTNVPLNKSGLPFADRMAAGNLSIAIYNSSTGKNEAVKALDFSSINPPGIKSFDPTKHSLEDVRTAINATYPGQVSATIEAGKLRVTAASGKKFSFAGDTSGLLAGLGINTFYEGSNADDIALNKTVKADQSYICSGHVNGAGEVNKGDNTTARKLAALAKKSVKFQESGTETTLTLQGYLSNLVARVGSDTAEAKTAATLSKTQLKFLNDRQQSVGGVNVNEEMLAMKRLSQNYRTASQMIQIANEMYDTLLSLR